MEQEVSPAYTAAHSAAAFTDSSAHGWLRLTGRDRLNLLHHLSTNGLSALHPGDGLPTVLTSPTGRVMALLIVCAAADAATLRTQPGQAQGVARYLNSMIFWQDQVEVADLSAETAQFGLYGPGSAAALAQLSGADLADVPPYGWRAAQVAGADVTLHRGGPLEAPAWMVVVPAAASGAVREAQTAAMPALDAETADLLRIEAGIPMWGRELSDQVTPLESGLLSAVSFTKGCYTGQEVIARQTNYDRVTRNLVGLFLGSPPALPSPRDAGEGEGWGAVLGSGRGGFVGSAAWSPASEQLIALAVVPRDLARPGTQVTVVKDGEELQATVAALPFPVAR
jgi:folate-binding protein YgfZ